MLLNSWYCSGCHLTISKSHKFNDTSRERKVLCCGNPSQRWRQGRNAGGTKTVRVLTASEVSKIFTDHTFKIGLKCDYTLYKHNKQVTEVTTVHRNFQKFKCRWGGSVNFWGAPPKHPPVAPSLIPTNLGSDNPISMSVCQSS